jgi:itaconate CoA-transferase
MLPLTGITVVSIEQAIAAPYCTRQLADNGARIIKIERAASSDKTANGASVDPGGDFARYYDKRACGLSSHFAWTNRSKESITLDLKHPRAKEVLGKLIARADVCVQNLAPGAASRIGFDAKAIHALNPRAIVCGISGYGESGSYQLKKAYDALIQAESGLLSITGEGDALAKPGISIADIAAGVTAYTGILNALILRGRQPDANGAVLDVSMLEALGEWMGFPLHYTLDGAPPPARTGAAHATIYPYGPFKAGDGNIVMMAIQNEREWVKFCEGVMGDAALARDPLFNSVANRSTHRDTLKNRMESRFSAYTAAQVIALMDKADIANAAVNDLAALHAHPQLKERNRWQDVQSSAGVIPQLKPVPATDAYTPRMDPIPALGEHTDAILGEIGYDAQQIATLRAEHVI